MYEQSGIQSLSAFIKTQLFGKTFKVHYIDDNTRIFIDKHSSLHAHYRTISVEYSNLIHLLRQNFTEKKAMSALYKLKKITIYLVKLNREIVSLSQSFENFGGINLNCSSDKYAKQHILYFWWYRRFYATLWSKN